MAEKDYLYVVKKPCPICGQETRATKVRSRLITETVDNDLCTHYKDINPYYYRIWLCEHCGYAEDERHFLNGVAPREKRDIQEFLAEHKSDIEFKEQRTRDDAIKALKLAIFYTKFTKETFAHKAGLNLTLAWLYREAGDKENEEKFLTEAGLHLPHRCDPFPLGRLRHGGQVSLHAHAQQGAGGEGARGRRPCEEPLDGHARQDEGRTRRSCRRRSSCRMSREVRFAESMQGLGTRSRARLLPAARG